MSTLAALQSQGKPKSGDTLVVVHPLVLLSVVDHYNRLSLRGQERAVGILLGSWQKKGKVLDIANSFAIPFEENPKDPDVWFFDHNYLERMYTMFRKVNAKEKVVGWYHTGPKLRQSDIQINELIKRYVPNPILVIIDAHPKDLGLPTQAYVSVEEVHDDGSPTTRTFEDVSSMIDAEEAEEVGVEHLLRDIKDLGSGTSLTERIQTQLASLKGMLQSLRDIDDYLDRVIEKKMRISNSIMYKIQEMFNLMPNLDVEKFVRSYAIKTNDSMAIIYLASLVRSVIALHNLINNKIANRQLELELDEKEDGEQGKNGDKDDEEKGKNAEKATNGDEDADATKD